MDISRLRKLFSLKPAVSSRNLTSLLLVGLFFGVYVAAGGKVTSVPDIRPGQGFGTVEVEEEETIVEIEEQIEEDNIAVKKPTSKVQRRAPLKRESKKANREVESQIEDFGTFDDEDDLSSIEKRLKLSE